MAFKMKGPTMYKNGMGAKGPTTTQKTGYEGQADGRATSSPFQQKAEEKPKPKKNQFGETPEEYKKRMEEMGLRKPDKKAPPVKQTAKQAAKLPKAIVSAIAKKEGKSPLEQRLSSTKGGGEGQDQDKIFNKKGEHVGDYKNGKKVMHTKAQHAKMANTSFAKNNKQAPAPKMKTKKY
tara:strand:+ start:1674 stop:2207 length:534 start_codon:yes stop_codon:yes gene_type:complete